MVTHQRSTLEQTGNDVPTTPWSTTIGLVAALVLTIGFLVWQISGSRSSTPVADPQAVDEAAPAPAGNDAYALPPTLFIVASDEAAGDFAAALEALAPRRPASLEQIVVMPADEDIARLRQSLVEINRLRDIDGLAPIQVIDARRPASSASEPSGGPDPVLNSAPAQWEARTGRMPDLSHE